jgi:hypothetical protein
MRATFLTCFLILLVGCGLNNSWDKYADSLTTTQPKQEDVFGSYLLTRQTITTNGVTALGGRSCQLELRADGSFAVTNYPTWTNSQLEGFISATGHWRCATVGSVHDNQTVWGIRFADTDRRMDLLSFTGKAAPYGLLMTYGDPDENAVMIFEKK